MRMEIFRFVRPEELNTVRFFLRNTTKSQTMCTFWNNADNRLDAVHIQRTTVECELWDWADKPIHARQRIARVYTHSFRCLCFCEMLLFLSRMYKWIEYSFFCIVTIYHTTYVPCTLNSVILQTRTIVIYLKIVYTLFKEMWFILKCTQFFVGKSKFLKPFLICSTCYMVGQPIVD